MKDLDFRLKIVQNVLTQLANEFNVDKPKLIIKNMKTLHGFYALNTITLNSETLHDNLASAVKTIRHEFCHYIQDIFNLTQSEIKAKYFEKNVFCLHVLPKTQTRLLEEDAK